MSKFIITTDLHLTSKPEDVYRFGLFPWLMEKCQKHKVGYVFILGDLTDLKDNHSSKLVTDIVHYLTNLAKFAKVVILKGNHDYIDPNYPFFGFVNRMEGIRFITMPGVFTFPFRVDKFLMLPHSKDPLEDWGKLSFKGIDYIMLHQTIKGSLASNGQEMDGLKKIIFKRAKARIYSGDIHVPQTIGNVEYVGSPYHVHFGDTFKPRVLLVSGATQRDLHYPTVCKHTIRINHPDKLRDWPNLHPKDQVKVRLSLGREEYVDWQKHKRQVVDICKELDLDLYGVELEGRNINQKKSKAKQEEMNYISDPNEVFDKFCTRHKVSKYVRGIGSKLIEENL